MLLNICMHEFNSDTAAWFTVYTLIDITQSSRRKDTSQKNWDMIINCLSMVCQPLGSHIPVKKKRKLTKFSFGSEYKNKIRNVWIWSFAVEQQGIITIEKLVEDLNGIPMVDRLEYVETKSSKIKNTYFSIKEMG
jgi:hypothetical protein